MVKNPPPSDRKPLWDDIIAYIKTEVSPDTFSRWFKDLALSEMDDERLVLRVPNNIYQFWIESNYMALVQSSIMLALGGPRKIQFVFDAEADGGTNRSVVAPSAGSDLPAP